MGGKRETSNEWPMSQQTWFSPQPSSSLEASKAASLLSYGLCEMRTITELYETHYWQTDKMLSHFL